MGVAAADLIAGIRVKNVRMRSCFPTCLIPAAVWAPALGQHCGAQCPVKPGQAGADSTSVSVTFLLAMVKFLTTEI